MEIQKADIEKLHTLARLAMSDDTEVLAKDLNNIIAFVGAIDAMGAVAGDEDFHQSYNENIVRDDNDPHDSDLYTESLLDAFPKKEGRLLEVKNILENS